jgi:Ankyrin repeats (many copies)
MELNLLDLPQDILWTILRPPFSSPLECTVLGRVCKTTADIVRGLVLKKRVVCESAAVDGHLEVLKWARDNGCPPSNFSSVGTLCDIAARGGHLEVLKWAVANGCTLDIVFVDYLARVYGHSEISIWLDDYGGLRRFVRA